MAVILTIVLYADVVDYNIDDFTSPLLPLEKLNDEERKWSTCDGERSCLWPATFKTILLVEDFQRNFSTLLGWSYTTSTITIQSFLARADKDVNDHLKMNSLLWTF